MGDRGWPGKVWTQYCELLVQLRSPQAKLSQTSSPHVQTPLKQPNPT